jgi:hypothetical protein
MKEKDFNTPISVAEMLAEECGVKVWKVYYVRQKLKLDRLPTVEEVLTYKGQVGRPLKDINYVQKKKKTKR